MSKIIQIVQYYFTGYCNNGVNIYIILIKNNLIVFNKIKSACLYAQIL